jgi:hypothetical protein
MSARQWDEQQQKQVVFAISQKAPVVCHNSVAYSVYMHIDCLCVELYGGRSHVYMTTTFVLVPNEG